MKNEVSSLIQNNWESNKSISKYYKRFIKSVKVKQNEND
tara:strand:+ start:574 stop:690 length:117 start_codon:yes stop_codon:yes gene_type:complete